MTRVCTLVRAHGLCVNVDEGRNQTVRYQMAGVNQRACEILEINKSLTRTIHEMPARPGRILSPDPLFVVGFA
jgi:hypothetical protein